VELRNPNKSHYPLVLALLERCFQPAWEPQALADRIYYDPHYDPSHVWMAREQGKVLGFLVTTLDGDKAYLKLLAVDPEARRKGLATDMLSRAEYRSSGEGAKALLIEGTPPFEFLPGVPPGSEAEAFFRSQGYSSSPAEVLWVAVDEAAAKAAEGFDKSAAARFAQKTVGQAWPWVEETLGYQPPRMAYSPGQGLILAEPGHSLGPLWLDPAASDGSAETLIASGRAIAQSLPVIEPRGLRFFQVAGSQGLPVGSPYTTQSLYHFRKTLT
jgi:GNAT superfamily N-acetyltransferase